MDYTSHTGQDLKKMLDAIGVSSVEELIGKIIPGEIRLKRTLDLPDCAPEPSLSREFTNLAGENLSTAGNLNFLGGGVYDHYLPALVGAIISRSEFSTAYTPYQAEVSQGTLQTIYEFQTMIARLTGMDAANASHYDGATALAEAVLLTVRAKKKNKVVLPAGLNPHYKQVLATYCTPSGVELMQIDSDNGRIDLDRLREEIQNTACLVIQQPNFFGLLEPAMQAAEIAHEAGSMVVSSTYPTPLALLTPPGEWGADIATAEGQPFGIPTSLGGPYLGLFAVKKPLIRKMPGRLVARTKDKNGLDGYVLTLQTREQHIRREKATSNICTNQALMALSALVYMSLTGRDGLKQIANDCYRRAHYLAEKIEEIPGCNLYFNDEYFNEFVLELPLPARIVQNRLEEKGIFAGPVLEQWYPEMKNCLLVAVTEKRIRADLDEFAIELEDILRKEM